MRYYLTVITLLVLIISLGSCRKDFEYTPSTGNLEFSRDTIFLDTVFANIGSSTYSLKVYNRSKEDISIPFIGLEQGETSYYRLNVDGVAGKTFADIPLMAKDSLYIFIETTVDIKDETVNQLLYTDILQFGQGSNSQQIPLVTLVQDAILLFPESSSDGQKQSVVIGFDNNGNEILSPGFELKTEQLRFTNEKPYIIYGFAVVPKEQKLVIDAGARVYFHDNSGIVVQSKGSISINGTLSTDEQLLENEVIFEGDRLEPEYEDVSGQWEGIRIATGSIDNIINYFTLKNATIGIFAQGESPFSSPTLHIKNSQIYNSSKINLWGKTAVVTAENLVLGSAGNSSLYCNLGGSYSFTHTTIANYWTESYRPSAALTINNFEPNEQNGSTGIDLIKADFKNCIIDGNGDFELSHSSNGINAYNFLFSSCLITANTANIPSGYEDLYNFENNENYQNSFLNQPLEFVNATQNNFRLKPTSPALDKGDKLFALDVPLDILGTNREELPDLGAYEFTTLE
ncbi:choice-of-anchor Q domain-containing protein [Zobellia nedashkovskayae]